MSNIEALRKLAEKEGITLTETLAILEHETGRRVDSSVWSRWARGKRNLPPDVNRVINRYIAGYVLKESGLPLPDNPAKLESLGTEIADMFSPPETEGNHE